MYCYRLHVYAGVLVTTFMTVFSQMGCLPKKMNVGHLEHMVGVCHEDIKWKRFVEATRCYLPKRRRAFQKWFRGGAEDLYIDSIEVHELKLLTHKLPYQAEVVVALKSYRLPSTTLKTITITEYWELLEGQWFLSGAEPDLFALEGQAQDLDPQREEK